MVRNGGFHIWVSAAFMALAYMVSSPVSFAAAPVSVEPATMPRVGTIDERFQSFNIEMVQVTGGRFWAPYRKKSGNAPEIPSDAKNLASAGMNSSLFQYRPPIDLYGPRLRKLADGLSPSYVRVSGTWANSTYFEDARGPAPKTPPAGFKSILTRKEWKGVVDFSNAVNAKLVTSFAISPGVRNADGVWNPVQAKKIFAYTKSVGGSIAAAEMFNEPTFAIMGGAPAGYDAAAYGRDFKVFVPFVKKTAPAMLILGPGGVGEVGLVLPELSKSMIKTSDILKAEGPGLDRFSYHFYGAVSKRCAMTGSNMGTTPAVALTRDWLMRTDRDEAFYAGLRDKYSPGTPLWLTETGEAACGGDPWAADFIDSFRYLNQLGTLAKHGVQVVMHNTLNASDYGLVDGNTLIPRPNYWSALLWRKMMGTTVLDAGKAAGPNLYLYAHCLRGEPGGVALLAINADRTTEAELTVPDKSQRYTLSGELMSNKVDLNGQELNVMGNGDLPEIHGTAQPAGLVKLAPASITFLAFSNTGNVSCK